ncbi:hypothetical protein [Sulfitobacter mediterraneus]|nr:hypothetical protein [Sulfitobacter mediterraneus]
MPINDADYPDGQAGQEAKLGALGFDTSGHRGGGIGAAWRSGPTT